MTPNNSELIREAVEVTRVTQKLAETKPGWKFMGYVGAALITRQGNLYTGINISLMCGIGFCAEHSAIAEMVKHGETEIAKIVAATSQGTVLPPCGRCREIIYQIDRSNSGTLVILDEERAKPLSDLLPEIWQEAFDVPLY